MSFLALQASDFGVRSYVAIFGYLRLGWRDQTPGFSIMSWAGDPMVPMFPPPVPIYMALKKLTFWVLMGRVPLCQLVGLGFTYLIWDPLPPRKGSKQNILTSDSQKDNLIGPNGLWAVLLWVILFS